MHFAQNLLRAGQFFRRIKLSKAVVVLYFPKYLGCKMNGNMVFYSIFWNFEE